MSSGLMSAASGCAFVRATSTFSATATIKSLAAGMFALSLMLFAASGYAQEIASQPRTLQRHSLLNLNKQLKAPQSYFIKAACPSYSSCCCVIGGYAACMTSNECSALGGSCTGRC
jgi:hypothetical protein